MKIGFLGDNFKRVFVPLVEGKVEAAKLVVHQLTRYATALDIASAIPAEKRIVTIGQIYDLWAARKINSQTQFARIEAVIESTLAVLRWAATVGTSLPVRSMTRAGGAASTRCSLASNRNWDPWVLGPWTRAVYRTGLSVFIITVKIYLDIRRICRRLRFPAAEF